MQIRVKQAHASRVQMFFKNPLRVISTSFALVILVGAFLLTLPISARSGEFTPFIDALFTATSATCVTGLIVFDTYNYFTTFGQIVIIGLIQLGGLGLVTITTFFNFAIRKKMGLKNLQLAQESVNSEDRQNVGRLLRMIMIITFSFEAAGALCLMTVFIPQFGLEGIFISVFLAISGYCNAGFDVLGRIQNFGNLSPYFDNPVVLGTIMLLIICGGLGFVVWMDLVSYRRTHRMMLHTKIVVMATIFLIVIGTVSIAALEWNNSKTIGGMTNFQKILNSMFLSVSCRTAGFNSFDLNSMHDVTKLVCSGVMFIGAAPGSTGGGIKVTTFVVLAMTVICVLTGREDTVVLGRKVDKGTVFKGLAVAVLASLAVLVATSVCVLTIHADGQTVTGVNALFESVSAFATVGLSAGVTGVANIQSKIVLILTMFIGRVGPVSLALGLAARQAKDKHQVIPEGKIMVG